MDADRTLFDFDTAQEEALKATLELPLSAQGKSFDPEVLKLYREISNHLWGMYEKCEITQAQLQRSRFQILLEKLGIPVGEESADAYNRKFVEQLGEGAYLIDGAETLCRRLFENGYPLFIVTNGIESSQKKRLEKSAIQPYIQEMFISEAVGFPKPRKEFFDFVFAKIGEAHRPHSIILGDSLSTDIAGGIQAGIDTCWYNSGGLNNPNLPCTYEIRKLLDFFTLDGIL